MTACLGRSFSGRRAAGSAELSQPLPCYIFNSVLQQSAQTAEDGTVNFSQLGPQEKEENSCSSSVVQ